ncbi:MAG: tetratricopeptide repeat protein, partial [Candidatus Nitrosocosmicus sp.]|nr:tetratricopeptide repeat protein [Candidatus Nitrosocosmicus sp.]
VYSDLGDYPKALEYHNKAREIHESLNDRLGMSRDYNNIGLVYSDLGDYPKALEYHNKARDIDERLINRDGNKTMSDSHSNDSWLALVNDYLVNDYVNIGLTLDSLEDYHKAIEYYDMALKISPQSVLPLDNKGYVLYELEKHDEAIRLATMAIELDSTYANVWYNRAIYYAHTDRIDEAIGDLKEAISLNEQYGQNALTDKDFDKIRDNPRFVELLKGFK